MCLNGQLGVVLFPLGARGGSVVQFVMGFCVCQEVGYVLHTCWIRAAALWQPKMLPLFMGVKAEVARQTSGTTAEGGISYPQSGGTICFWAKAGNAALCSLCNMW